MPVKISSIIIAKNEEANIKRCIESQLDCIDEIVLLIDSETTDRTKAIAGNYDKVIVEVTKWQGYAKTKQYAVSKTSNDWIFWIDADEEITKELCEEIKLLKEKEEFEVSAFEVARRAFFLGKWIKHSGWYPGRVTRFFNKRKAVFNDNQVHENLLVEGETGRLKNDLNHYTDPDIFHYYQKFNRYTTLAAEELSEKGRKAGYKDLVIRPIFLFFKMYILRAGFLDGIEGFILAVFSANYVFTKYSKLIELNKKRQK
jgi:glycosyltransferase involved in cell wall biosynthesis